MFNPSARGLSRQRPGFFQRTIDTLAEDGIAASAVPTSGPGAATELAREALETGADLLLAAGGDGTINEVVNGMAGSR
ncbi:MAG: diacylglycerol/lipid kinase family protein, partial [Bryobacteraceae bacterium]